LATSATSTGCSPAASAWPRLAAGARHNDLLLGGCALSKAAILTIFQNLAYVGNSQSIDVGSNSGAKELSTTDLAVANGKV